MSQKHGTLILICGLPGAGKTSLAKRLEVERSALRMCPDDWIEAIVADPADMRERDRLRDPVENLQWELTQGYLLLGLTVILENGFWSEEERGLYAMGALALGARIELYSCEAPDFESLWRRVEGRNASLKSPLHVLTRDELQAAWDVFQAPTPEELAFYDDCGVVT